MNIWNSSLKILPAFKLANYERQSQKVSVLLKISKPTKLKHNSTILFLLKKKTCMFMSKCFSSGYRIWMDMLTIESTSVYAFFSGTGVESQHQ